MDKINSAYCVLPFNHMNLHPNGNVSLCCVAQMFPPNDGFYKNDDKSMCNLNDNTVNDMWQKSSVELIRTDMLNGIVPLACQGCHDIEKNGGESRRQIENKRWKHHKTPKLEFLDLRMSNKCNLKCMMCFPDSSTSLSSHYNKWSEKLDFVEKKEINQERFHWFNEDFINQLMEHKHELKYLYINGGEPFIIEEHWEFLQRLIDEGVARNIRISYNTNCTVYDDRCDEIWKHFNRVTLGLSIDAVGDKNKFIRYPSNWEITKKNTEKFFNNKSLCHINITCSIQWLNAPFLNEFYDWAVPIIQTKEHSTINQNFVVFPDYLSLNCTSKEFKKSLFNKYNKSKHKDMILTSTMLSYLNNDSHNEDVFNKGKLFCDEVQKTRKMNWREIFEFNY